MLQLPSLFFLVSINLRDRIAQFPKQILARGEKEGALRSSAVLCLPSAQFMDHGQFVRSNVVYQRGRRIEHKGDVSTQEAVFWNNTHPDKDVSPVT